MTSYRVWIETAKPIGWATVRHVGPRVYRIQTSAGPHAAVALAVAQHLQTRAAWPVYDVHIERTGSFGFFDAVAAPPAGVAADDEPSRRFRVSFPTASYTVATWRGDFKAVAIATAEHLRRGAGADLEHVAVEELGPGPAWGDGAPSDDLVDFGYEWRV